MQFKITQKLNQASGTYSGVGLNPSNPSGFSISKTGLRMSTGGRIQAQTEYQDGWKIGVNYTKKRNVQPSK